MIVTDDFPDIEKKEMSNLDKDVHLYNVFILADEMGGGL